MTDKTNVITVSNEDLAWINKNVPGKSKRERLAAILVFYKDHHGGAMTAPGAPGVKA